MRELLDAVLVTVAGRIILLRVDIGAHRLDRREFILADAAVHDLLEPVKGVEGPLAVLALDDREGQRPQLLADLHRAAVALAVEQKLLCRALLDRRERFVGVLVGLEFDRVEAEQCCDRVRTFRLKRLLEGVERRLRRVESRRIEVRRERSDLGDSYVAAAAASCAEAGSDAAMPNASAAAQTERRRPA